MNPTEQAHRNLKNILLNGRILINGLPPTSTEINGIIQGEQHLYEKAVQSDKEAAGKKQEAPKKLKLKE